LVVDAGANNQLRRRWLLRLDVNGKRREMGLGSYPAIGLAEARLAASNARAAAKENRDPIEARRKERKAAIAVAVVTAPKTLRDVAAIFHKSHAPSWRSEKTRIAWLSPLEIHAHQLLDMPVAEVDTAAIVSALQPIWLTKSETARRVRGRIERVLDSARVLGLTPADKANPARLRGNLEHLLPKSPRLTRGHHRALPWQQMPAFMAALREQQGVVARLTEFIALTAARSGEARHATWGEFDLDSATWTVPASKMKSGKRHRVPLSTRAVEIIREMQKVSTSDFVFPGNRQGTAVSDMAPTMALRRSGRADIGIHGMRSSFRDWVGESTNFARELAEISLAHVVGDATERAYARGDALDRRRPLMEAWCQYCAGQSGADVIPLNRGRNQQQVEV
ncbi:MAG: integrase, partial [Hyphomicrobium sp.]